MNALPQELIDVVFASLLEYDFPITSRFAILSTTSRSTILSARQVQRRFFSSKTLQALFVSVLEDTPFVWYAHRIPKLEEISRSAYAERMKTLSICGMDFDLAGNIVSIPGKGAQVWRDRFDKDSGCCLAKYFGEILQRFPQLRHLRYYPMSPKCVDGSWADRTVSVAPRAVSMTRSADFEPSISGYPPLVEAERTWRDAHAENGWLFNNVLHGASESGLPIESLTIPLFGNRAFYFAIPDEIWSFSKTITRLSLTLTSYGAARPLPRWLHVMTNLEFLEIALSRTPNDIWERSPFYHNHPLLPGDNVRADNIKLRLPKVREFRLMSDNQRSFSEHQLLLTLILFPNLRRLGFAHILISEGSWSGLLSQIESINLERLWLLDPRHIYTDGFGGPAGDFLMLKYEEDQYLRSAAQEVHLIDSESLWTADEPPPKTRDFEYPGFAIFEQD
ncbi:hypothetical protein P153DRAFT_387342 [Dothidotthia symphoricarpi CBS 119687]|uniref:Uncharacterized protein n=1 Tax=Dothidotthia symphoricarpi CBS 119687 TaxID=1392245 RepID=A0A6A6A704_9PLEO|nr:uncharacterized protein P153DRAFT_387342 [Dothidotthia symphoricarpi CBS 119687]KAF2127600.1 hypothetical protein P153DRAFT_387342 [Dothidotthia symphoricarpi CBS 119687]